LKVLIQRVLSADCLVDNQIVSSIKKGLLIFLGVCRGDDDLSSDYLVKKCAEIRLFSDDNDKLNLSVQDIQGEILLISQFTLCARTKKGRRPDFVDAEQPVIAEKIYLDFARKLKALGIIVKTGIFGADMKISLINDGPVTIIIEKKKDE